MSSEKKDFKLLIALSLGLQLGFVIIAPLIGFIWLGSFLDRALNSSLAFLLAGIFIGLGITTYETYHLLVPLIDSAENKKDEP